MSILDTSSFEVGFPLGAAAAMLMAWTSAMAEAQTGQITPSRRTIAALEADIAFWNDAGEVGLPGVIGASDAGRRWKVKVRQLDCTPSGMEVLCSYQTRPCYDAASDDDHGKWCTRQRRFVRGGGIVMADGWKIAPSRKPERIGD